MVRYKDFLGQTVHVKVDRPLGSLHPTFHFEYPLNYGFIPQTQAEDGEEIDVYVLGLDVPVSTTQVTIVAIIQRNDVDENKLVGTLDGSTPSAQTILEAVHFQEQFFDSRVVFD